jgi:exopolysaccharide biosynthesis polyprenyl glycosylphosphotransferase
MPLLVFNQAPTGASDRVLKRLFDILGSLAFMLVFSPVYLAIAILVRLTSKGPIIYSQLRMGADGRVFTFYKFRSMRIDAESVTGAVWAVKNDDRTTPIGHWLRRTSLDEIPQFFNVLRGDMALVGPRPERPVFVDQFRKEIPKYMLRHRMKSGITGWAQVNGWRGNTSLEQRIKHDLYYIGHWSHRFDLKILCLTVVKGFVHRHAY